MDICLGALFPTEPCPWARKATGKLSNDSGAGIGMHRFSMQIVIHYSQEVLAEQPVVGRVEPSATVDWYIHVQCFNFDIPR